MSCNFKKNAEDSSSKHTRNTGMRIKFILLYLLVAAIFLLAAFFGGRAYQYNIHAKEPKPEPEIEYIEKTEYIEKKIIARPTNEILHVQLEKISELATYEGLYDGIYVVPSSRVIGEFEVPGTKNSLTIIYEGIVKAGYDLSTIVPEIDHDALTISIKLPDAMLLDNYLKMSDLQQIADNNILNPIDIDQLPQYYQAIEKEGLLKVEQNNIYEKAEENVKDLIRIGFSGFPEYEVIFN